MSCTSGKVAYDSKATAVASLKVLRGRSPQWTRGMQAYRCDMCQLWHVGHYGQKKVARRRRINARRMR